MEPIFNYFAAASCRLAPAAAKVIPTWYKYLKGEMVAGRCSPVIDLDKDLPKILVGVFEIVLFIGGVVAVIFILYGGFQYLISQGEPDKAKNARSTILNAVIGLVITIFATAIVGLLAGSIK